MFYHVGIALVDSFKNLQERIRVDRVGDGSGGLQLLRDSVGIAEEHESLRELLAQRGQRSLLFQQVLTRGVKRGALCRHELVLRG